MQEDALERLYRESLEERLIANLAKEKRMPLEDAMDAYYCSKLSQKIGEGMGGVQYLDYRTLTDVLCETEPELFQSRSIAAHSRGRERRDED